MNGNKCLTLCHRSFSGNELPFSEMRQTQSEAKMSKIDAYLEDRPREWAFFMKLLLPEYNRRIKAIN